jgi:hypothetical protein
MWHRPFPETGDPAFVKAFAHVHRSELGVSAPSRGHERRFTAGSELLPLDPMILQRLSMGRRIGLISRILGGAALPLILSAVLTVIPAFPAKSEAVTPYPLEICVVSGDKLGTDAVVFSYHEREIKTCCTNCVDEFYKDPSGFVAKIEESASKAAKQRGE